METKSSLPLAPELALPPTVRIDNMALEAASVAEVAAYIASLPCRNLQEADTLQALLAPSKQAGHILTRIKESRMEITRHLDDLKTRYIDYERELCKPLEQAIEAAKAKVKATKDAEIERQKQAERQRNARLNELNAMSQYIAGIWQGKREEVLKITDLQVLLDKQKVVNGFVAVTKAPTEWQGFTVEYLAESNHQLANFKALIEEIVTNWDNPEGRPRWHDPSDAKVATPTVSLAAMTTIADAPAEPVVSGVRKVLVPVVADWRKVDVQGMVAALLDNPTAMAQLEKLLAKLPKGHQVLGVDWVEEHKLHNR